MLSAGPAVIDSGQLTVHGSAVHVHPPPPGAPRVGRSRGSAPRPEGRRVAVRTGQPLELRSIMLLPMVKAPLTSF
ncbi:hypothetical protein WEI85_36620 [Actinomycetes bacterium KLBMP 9797]